MADLVELIVVLNVDGRTTYQLDDIASVIEDQPDFDGMDGTTLRDSLADAWNQLGYRIGRFDENYPFRLVKSGLRLKPALTPGSRIYLMLLVCSRLRSFSRTLRSNWATTFTTLSCEALRELMPATAKVKIFDANSSDRRTYFGTDLRKALKVLGKDLAVHATFDDECDQRGSSGDAGIDLVAIAPWNDKATGIHVILGQCAARETEWPEKRFEAHSLALKALFSFLVDPVNAVFIPVLYRETTGAWVVNSAASGCLLVDRLRIMLLLRRPARQSQIASQAWFRKFEREFKAVKKSLVPSVA